MDSIIWMYDRGNCGHEGFLIMGRLTPINEGVTIPFRGELPMFWPWHAWRPCSVMQLRGPIMAATGQTLALTLSKCWAQTFDQPQTQEVHPGPHMATASHPKSSRLHNPRQLHRALAALTFLQLEELPVAPQLWVAEIILCMLNTVNSERNVLVSHQRILLESRTKEMQPVPLQTLLLSMKAA